MCVFICVCVCIVVLCVCVCDVLLVVLFECFVKCVFIE